MTTTNNGIPYCAGGCGRMLHMDSSDDDQCVHCRMEQSSGLAKVNRWRKRARHLLNLRWTWGMLVEHIEDEEGCSRTAAESLLEQALEH